MSEGSNLYHTSARARESISVTDSGGDGSLAYDSSTGVITYTGPSASETRSHFSGGTGVSITNGSIFIGQSVGTGDSVTFSNITSNISTINISPSNGSTINITGDLIPTSDVAYNLGNSTNRFNEIYLSSSTIYLGSGQIKYENDKLEIFNGSGDHADIDIQGHARVPSLPSIIKILDKSSSFITIGTSYIEIDSQLRITNYTPRHRYISLEFNMKRLRANSKVIYYEIADPNNLSNPHKTNVQFHYDVYSQTPVGFIDFISVTPGNTYNFTVRIKASSSSAYWYKSNVYGRTTLKLIEHDGFDSHGLFVNGTVVGNF